MFSSAVYASRYSIPQGASEERGEKESGSAVDDETSKESLSEICREATENHSGTGTLSRSKDDITPSREAQDDLNLENSDVLREAQISKEKEQRSVLDNVNKAPSKDFIVQLQKESDSTNPAPVDVHLYHDLEELCSRRLRDEKVTVTELQLEMHQAQDKAKQHNKDSYVSAEQLPPNFQEEPYLDEISKKEPDRDNVAIVVLNSPTDLVVPKDHVEGEPFDHISATEGAHLDAPSASLHVEQDGNNGVPHLPGTLAEELEKPLGECAQEAPEEAYLELFQYRPAEFIEMVAHTAQLRKSVPQRSDVLGETRNNSLPTVQGLHSGTTEGPSSNESDGESDPPGVNSPEKTLYFNLIGRDLGEF